MKCECGKRIPLRNIILPWKRSYVLIVVDDNGQPSEKIRLCPECYNTYKILVKMVMEFGQEHVFEVLDKLKEERKNA
jgi:hypothetical protein